MGHPAFVATALCALSRCEAVLGLWMRGDPVRGGWRGNGCAYLAVGPAKDETELARPPRSILKVSQAASVDYRGAKMARLAGVPF
jgi:hypothetical protein